MKTIEIKGWIFAEVSELTGGVVYKFSEHDYEQWALEGDSHYAKYTKLAEHVITAEVEEKEIDPTALMVKALEAEKEKLHVQFKARVMQINERLAQLQALTFDPA